MFFFKRSKVVVDCFTLNYGIEKLFPIQETNNFYPEWWKSLPKSYEKPNQWGLGIPQPTMKGCIGFINLYTHGFVLPLWTDLLMQTTKDSWLYEFAAPNDIVSHDEQQFGEPINNYHHIKITSPWFLVEKSGINFMWTVPTFNNIENLGSYHILPGIMDYKYNIGTNINMLLPKTDNKILLKAGHPMAHIVPITDKAVELRTHVITQQELNKIEVRIYDSSFTKRYNVNKRILERKCPFGRSE
jgi:hypothetical protein